MKVSIFDLYGISLIRTKFGTFTIIFRTVLSDASGDASIIIADNCNALSLIPPSAERSILACLISYVNYVALVKFLICHSLLLILDEELADLSLQLAFFPSP